ncbi:MAG: hypothetical protein R2797_02875 [Gelidibacter sp.]
MKTLLYCCLLLMLSCDTAKAQEVPLTKGAALLFKDVTCMATNPEKNKVFELTGFEIADNGTQFYFKGDTDGAQFPFDAHVYPLDINTDGLEDIGLVFGNTYTSGGAGSTSLIYIKTQSGDYETNFGYPGSLVFIPTRHQGYPDTMIQGPGFEYALWTWNGKEYVFKSKITDKEASKFETIFLEDASNAYVDGLKH